MRTDRACLTADHPIERFLPRNRNARFFLVQHTKKGKIFEMTTKYTKKPQNIPNASKIDQMDIKYINIFHSKSLQNLPKLVFLV
jgi:hypothetical protein